jgi:membrane protein DedA with SNARE-associated domain
MEAVLQWLSQLPVAALYAILGLAAALENIFPPLPADTVVAFGAFLAARGQGTAVASFLATWLGNLIGAAIMYWVGRRYGSDVIRNRIPGLKGDDAERRLRALHGKYGLAALFISRFLPGVRAIVPPFAGALHLPVIPSLAVMGTASGLWYGAITWLAFRVGSSWEALVESVKSLNRGVGIAAAIVVALVLVAWLVLRSRRRVA